MVSGGSTFSQFLMASKSFFRSNLGLITISITAIPGFVFGYAISIALGLDFTPSLVLASITGAGAIVTGSLTGYLFLQSVSLASLSLLMFTIFRSSNSAVIEPGLIQVTYLVVLTLAPFLALLPKIKVGLSKLAAGSIIQLFSAVFFAGLVLLLRDRMPANSGFAMSQIYGLEDNAGIAGQLSMSLQWGFTPHVAGLGEFSNGIYLVAAGLTSQFGIEDSQALIAPFTHWNLTLLFLAWGALAATLAVVASGRKIKTLTAIVVILVTSGLLALLFWPFIGLGHTSVISSGLFAVVLLSLTLNRKLAIDHPLIFLSLVLSMSFIIGNIWFPFMPFAAATVALTFIGLLQVQYQRGRKRVVIALLGVIAIAALAVLPRVFELISERDVLIVLAGATRSATPTLILVWLILCSLAVWAVTKRSNNQTLLGANLFGLTIGTLLASSVFLVITGMLASQGSSEYGYGANKYLVTSIAMSLPVLWFVLVLSRRRARTLVASVTGLALAFGIFIAQPDHGLLLNTGVISLDAVSSPTAEQPVVSAIRAALETKPDHILCVSDDGQPMVVEGKPWNPNQWDAYLCTRWGDSLAGKSGPEGHLWRSTMINSMPEETLATVRDTYAEKRVAIIRIPGYEEGSSEMKKAEDQWWFKYVDSSWTTFPVR